MDCELNVQKRSCEEILPPSKHQRLEAAFSNENSNSYVKELNMQSLEFSNVLDINDDITCLTKSKSTYVTSPINNLQVTETSKNHSTNTCDDATSFPDSCCDFMPAKDYLNKFFSELEFSNISTPATNLDESLQKPTNNLSHAKNEMQNITPPTVIESATVISRTKGKKSILFQKELSDFIYLTLWFQNRQYYIHIREFKRNVFTKEDIPTKKGIIMDINSWYEFQYKIFAFNLRYKSSSFIANNIILVLNYNNSIMRIKNLKNYSCIELSDYQLEKLKEVAYDLNSRLIHYMYNNHLPHLIMSKCILGNIPQEKELMLFSKLSSSIEKNVLTVLNRIYECHGCILKHHTQSLHQCFMFNNREKFQQLGDMMLMLIDLDYVVSMFSNEVDYISESFLCNINVESIKNTLFQTEKNKI